MFNFKIYAIGAAIFVFLASVGIAYHEVVVAVQQRNINNLTAQVSKLETDNQTLTENVNKAVTANQSLVRQMQKYEEQTEHLMHLIAEANSRDEEITAWFTQTRETLASVSARQDVIDSFRKDPSGSITKANTEITCMLLNFGRQGICAEGVFVPFTNRGIPK